MTKKKDTSLNDMNGFFEYLQGESPRAAVVIAGAFLDEQLRQLILASFSKNRSVALDLVGSENNFDRPLSSFGSRINLAFCLGIINKIIYEDLHTIRKIRNKYAHQLHNYSWDEPEIVNWCKILNHSKMIVNINPNIAKSHNELFILAVVQISTWLGLELESKKNIK